MVRVQNGHEEAKAKRGKGTDISFSSLANMTLPHLANVIVFYYIKFSINVIFDLLLLATRVHLTFQFVRLPHRQTSALRGQPPRH